MKAFIKIFQMAVLGVLFFVAAPSFAQQQPPPPPVQPEAPPAPAAQFPDGSAYKDATITYNIIDAPNNTYGYDVFVDGRLMIHQASIPAMPGNEGFKTKEDAAKVAEMVMFKIRKGEMPPTVTVEELNSLGIK